MNPSQTIEIDGVKVPFEDGQTIMEAASKAGVYIPHLCHNPEFVPHGSCRMCSVSVNGRTAAACITPAAAGQDIGNETPEVRDQRRTLAQMLFVEGNHSCPSCEVSGNCQLQAVAYHVGMTSPRFTHFFPHRAVDASHPEVLLDLNRCILCELCVRASRDADGKNVFGVSGRGINARLVVNSSSGMLGDSDLDLEDRAAHVCPVGAILIKHKGFQVPIGERIYDRGPISDVGHVPPADRGDGRG